MTYPSEAGAPPGTIRGSDVAERAVEQAQQLPPAEERRERLLDLLSAVTDNLGEGIYALDTAGRVTFMNPAAEAMLGWTFADLRGRDMHEAIHFQHADGTPYPREHCPLLRVVGSGQVERVEDDIFTRSDGSTFSVSYVSAPIVRDGGVTGAVLAFHDTSAHKALDEALRRSERAAAAQASQLIAIFESIADAVIVYDRNGDIMRSNAADAELMGDPGSAASRHTTSLLHRDRLFTMHDEDGTPLAQERWPAWRVLRGEVLRGASAMDVFLHTLDGRDIVLNASGAPVRDIEGNIVGGVLIGRDVTQRRRLERQTRDALTALMEMAEALVGDDGAGSGAQTPVGTPHVARRLAELISAVMACRRVDIVAIEPDTEDMRVVAIAGLTAEQERLWLTNWPTAGHMRDYLPPALIERLHAGETIEIDRTQPPFNRWPNPFGSRTLLVIPMRVGGRLLGNVSLDYGATDPQLDAEKYAMAGAVAQLAAQIIERDRLARDRETAHVNALALSETTRRMDEFISVAAHELKTPVTNSQLAVTLARDTLATYTQQAEGAQAAATPAASLVDVLAPLQALLERTESHMERLSRLVVDLLDVSRIRAGKLELRAAPCDLAEVVREVVEEQRRIAPGRVIHLQLPGMASKAPIVFADADRIRQVVTNYISNALRYSRADQRVNVHLRTDGEWARVSVRDEGPGVPADERRRVWERFYRVPGTEVMSSGSVGLGLGLHISRTIVEQHHGRVGLRNARGGGAIFWFALQLMGGAP